MHETLAESLQQLALLLENLDFQFPQGKSAGEKRDQLLRRLREHLTGRGRDLDAPLVAVLVGSTGVGKSTILNSLVGTVASTSVQRPTTLTPLLVHNPEDELWIAGDRILGGFEKIRVDNEASANTERSTGKPLMEMKASSMLRPGIVLVDTPDTDSYRAENQQLASRLAEVADLWIFVTTAQRYAESQGLEILKIAAKRDTAVAIVLNRVGRGGLIDSKQGLAEKLAESGLRETSIFTILEGELDEGIIPESDIEPLRKWLENIASDALMHSALARQTFFGSLAEVIEQSDSVADTFAAEPEESLQIRSKLAEFGEHYKQILREEWFSEKVFTGTPISRFATYAWQVIEKDLCGNSWARKRLQWRRSLLASEPTPDVTRAMVSQCLDVAYQKCSLRLREAMRERIQNLEIEYMISDEWETSLLGVSVEAAKHRSGQESGIYQQWFESLSYELKKVKDGSTRPWDADTEQTLFTALLIRCFHPWEPASQELLLHYLHFEDMSYLTDALKCVMEETLDSGVSKVVEATIRQLPNTSKNVEKAKEIKKFISELQEQWFS